MKLNDNNMVTFNICVKVVVTQISYLLYGVNVSKKCRYVLKVEKSIDLQKVLSNMEWEQGFKCLMCFKKLKSRMICKNC